MANAAPNPTSATARPGGWRRAAPVASASAPRSIVEAMATAATRVLPSPTAAYRRQPSRAAREESDAMGAC